MAFLILHSFRVIRPAHLRPFRRITFTWFVSGLTPSWISFSTTVLSTSEIPMILTGNCKLWNCSKTLLMTYNLVANNYFTPCFNQANGWHKNSRPGCVQVSKSQGVVVIKVFNHVLALGSLRFMMPGFNCAFPLGKFWYSGWSQVLNAFLSGEQLWCWSALWMAWRPLPIHLWLRSRL